LLGVRLSATTYGRVDDRQFCRIVLWLLTAGGVLTVANLS